MLIDRNLLDLAHGNARSVAKIGSILAQGGQSGGHRFLSRDTVQLALQEQAYDEDLCMGIVRYDLGFGLHSKEFPAPVQSAFHWGGMGGSWNVMDMNTELSCAYVMNRCELDSMPVENSRQNRLWEALEQSVDLLAAAD